MLQKRTHQKTKKKIEELQARELPINRSYLAVNADGKLEERKGKLEERIVCGYGVIWDSVNDYGERFVKGCFSKSINDNGPASDAAFQIKFRDRHGKTCSLFAKLKEDNIGLYFETMPLDDVQWSNDLLVQLKSGSINNFSIGFRHNWERIEWDDENDVMVNLEAQLFEISAVDIPSDTKTYAVRSAKDNTALLVQVESIILKLPRADRLNAREIFARCMLPVDSPSGEHRTTRVKARQQKKGLDLHYLLKKL